MSNNLTPVEVCEMLIGPLSDLERIVGYRPKAGYGWRRPGKWRDAGDIPSSRLQRRLLAFAAAARIPLTAEHLIWGAPEAEIRALVAHGRDARAPEAAE